MGAYDNPKIIRDRSGEIYGQGFAKLGQQVAAGMKSNYLRQEQEAEKAKKEVEREQRIAYNVESKAYDLADRNYAFVAKEDPGLAQGFKDEVYTMLRGKGTEGEEGYVIGAIKAETYLQTKTDLTNEERQYYRGIVQNAKTFQNNAIAGGGKIINDLEDMKNVKPGDIASTHYWTGGNSVERDTSMLTSYALSGSKMDGVENTKKISSGPNGEMIVKVNTKVKEGSTTWNNLSEDTQAQLRENNYELTWERDMNKFEELIAEVPKGLDYNQISENSSFQKDGNINEEFIIGEGSGTVYETKSVNLKGKEVIIKSRLIDMNKLMNEDTFTADIKGKAQNLVGRQDGELSAFMRYKMKAGGFSVQEFRKKTNPEQLAAIEEALKEDFLNEKTSGKGMSSRIANEKDVAFYAKQGVDIEDGEKIYYQNMGESLVAKKSDNTYTKNQVKKGNYVNAQWNKNKERVGTFIKSIDAGSKQNPDSKKILADLQTMGLYGTPLVITGANGEDETIGFEVTNSASGISAKSRIIFNESAESHEAALKIALGQEFALENEWASVISEKKEDLMDTQSRNKAALPILGSTKTKTTKPYNTDGFAYNSVKK